MRLRPAERRTKLARLCLDNALALQRALGYCADHAIGSFRVPSTILPAKTHSKIGYELAELPGGGDIIAEFQKCGALAEKMCVRTTFHPDQFDVLNSPHTEVVARAIADLEYHGELADWLGADVINIHAGGAYGDRSAALTTLARNLNRLSSRVRSRLTIENDDRVFSVRDLIPVCQAERIPLVYDVHHHRCLPDGWSVECATQAAFETWDREPVFHLSSPRDGWGQSQPQRHHEYIDPLDFPNVWQRLPITIEVEAKAKELAIARLRRDLVDVSGTRRSCVRREKAQQRATTSGIPSP